MPDGWDIACAKSEERLKDYIPIEAINSTLCFDTNCPAAKVFTTPIPGGMMMQVWCIFSKCVHRLPEKKDLKELK